jgi:hypothetical protein
MDPGQGSPGRTARASAGSTDQDFLKPSESQLNTALEKLSIAFEIEAIEVPVAIFNLQSHVVGQVPVDPWRSSCEFPPFTVWLLRSE